MTEIKHPYTFPPAFPPLAKPYDKVISMISVPDMLHDGLHRLVVLTTSGRIWRLSDGEWEETESYPPGSAPTRARPLDSETE